MNCLNDLKTEINNGRTVSGCIQCVKTGIYIKAHVSLHSSLQNHMMVHYHQVDNKIRLIFLQMQLLCKYSYVIFGTDTCPDGDPTFSPAIIAPAIISPTTKS